MEKTLRLLYTRFLLRDVFGRMVPGTVVLAGAAVGISGRTPGESIVAAGNVPFVFQVMLIAGTWVLGLAARELGSLILGSRFEGLPGSYHFVLGREENARLLRRHWRRRLAMTGPTGLPPESWELNESAARAAGTLAFAFGLFIPLWLIGRIPPEGSIAPALRGFLVIGSLGGLLWHHQVRLRAEGVQIARVLRRRLRKRATRRKGSSAAVPATERQPGPTDDTARVRLAE